MKKCKKCGARTNWEGAIYCGPCQKDYDAWVNEADDKVCSFNSINIGPVQKDRGTRSDLYPERHIKQMNMPLLNRFGKSNRDRFCRISQLDWRGWK